MCSSSVAPEYSQCSEDFAPLLSRSPSPGSGAGSRLGAVRGWRVWLTGEGRFSPGLSGSFGSTGVSPSSRAIHWAVHISPSTGLPRHRPGTRHSLTDLRGVSPVCLFHGDGAECSLTGLDSLAHAPWVPAEPDGRKRKTFHVKRSIEDVPYCPISKNPPQNLDQIRSIYCLGDGNTLIILDHITI